MDISQLKDDEILDHLLGLTTTAIDALHGVQPPDSRLVESQDLAIKILFHAMSFRLLWNRPMSIPRVSGATIYDFSSGMVVARAAFDTVLTYHRVFVAPSTEDTKEFEYCLWRIKGLVSLEGLGPRSPEGIAKYQEHLSKLEDFRNRIQRTALFENLDRKRKTKVLAKGDYGTNKEYEAAGFHPQSFRRYYAYLSSYAHGDGHAAMQIRSAQSREDQRMMFGLGLHLVDFSLAKLTRGLIQTYPEAREACAPQHLALALAEACSEVSLLVGDENARQKAVELGFPPKRL